MTKEQIIKLLTNYAEENDFPFELNKTPKGNLSSVSTFESDEDTDDSEITHIILLEDEGVVTFSAEIPYEGEEATEDVLEEFLELLEEESEVFCYTYFSARKSVAVSVRWFFDEEDENDEEIDEEFLEALFYSPVSEIERISEAIEDISDGMSVEDAAAELEDEIEDDGTIRYHFEHRFFPTLFFEKSSELIEALLEEEGELVYDLLDETYEDNGLEIPFKMDEFKVYHRKPQKDYDMLRIVMPKPEKSLECQMIYLVYNAKNGKNWYFTVELERSEDFNGMFLCSWDSQGHHSNYCECKKDFNAIEKRIKEICGIK